MNHTVNVYYMYCPTDMGTKGAYRTYQRQVADKILNYGLRNMFGVDGTEKAIEKGEYGKPYLKGMEQYQYNISNTAGMVVCALSDICVGVDVERERPFKKEILRKCSSTQETAYIMEEAEAEQQQKRFFRLWTLKESYIKMTGEGMRIPLQEVEFQFQGDSEIKCSKEGGILSKAAGGLLDISVCTGEGRSKMDKNREFIAKYKAEQKGYCPCIIDAKGVIYECLKGHLEALLGLKEAESKLEEIPNDMSPLFYMTARTRAVVVDYENQLYSDELTQEQQDTLKELSENELIQINLINIHNRIKL